MKVTFVTGQGKIQDLRLVITNLQPSPFKRPTTYPTVMARTNRTDFKICAWSQRIPQPGMLNTQARPTRHDTASGNTTRLGSTRHGPTRPPTTEEGTKHGGGHDGDFSLRRSKRSFRNGCAPAMASPSPRRFLQVGLGYSEPVE